MSVRFPQASRAEVSNPAPASEVRVKSSSWEWEELTESDYLYVCLDVQ